MPGFFDAVRTALRGGGPKLSQRGIGMYSDSYFGNIAAGATSRLGRGLFRAGGMGNTALSASMGGIAGAGYGAVADDTSILGGAMMGAGLGMGAYGASRMRGMYQGYRAGGMGRFASAGGALAESGRRSMDYIGNSYARALGKISSLGQ